MLSLDDPLTLLRPAEVRFGRDALAMLPGWVRDRGDRVLVVADPFNAGRVDSLGLAGEGLCVEVFGEVEPEPGLGNLQAAVALADRVAPQVVIGFGGGSAMDLAKLVAVLTGTGLALTDVSGPDRAPARQVALVQVPTTAGTGSEVGTRALITDPATLNKTATESRHMLADLAVIDPALTATVPPAVTAATGVDAMAHCVEAYTSRRAHPLIDAYAIQGIELVARYLPRAVKDGGDLEARAGLSLAAFYGGICLGPVNTTAGHALSYPLGTRHKLPHGLANALVFPHTLAANEAAAPEKTARVRSALAGEGANADTLAVAMDFCAGLGIDMSLRAHGIPQDDLAEMAREAHAIRRLLDWNPRDLSQDDIRGIYEAAW